MKRLPLLLVLVLLSGVSTRQSFDFSITAPDVETALGFADDPMARLSYESKMLASPHTGQIPPNIRKRELEFESKIISKPEYLEASNARKAQQEWNQAGPFNVGGRTRGAGIDPRNEEIIIAGGVSGGIWKTKDGGNTWIRVTDPSVHNGISCMVQDPLRKDTWYAGTGEQIGNSAGNSAQGEGAQYRGNGIFKSTDNGDSWTLLPSTQDASPESFNSQFQYIWNIVTNNQKPETEEVLVATYGGILRSQNGGDSWDVVLGKKRFDLPDGENLNNSNDPSFTHIIQNSNGHFFASLSSATSTEKNYAQHGFYFSEDGENWVNINPSDLPDFHARTVIASGLSSPGNVYFFTYAGKNDNNKEIIRLWHYAYSSVNGGTPNGSWLNLSNNLPNFGGANGDLLLQSGYNMLVAVHPQNPNLVFLGGTNLYRSRDGFLSGNRSSWIGGYSTDGSNSQYPSHHADQHLLLFYPSNPDRILSCHDGGLSLSTSITRDSVIYRSLNNGYITSQFYSVQQQKDEATSLIMGGMQDNGSYVGKVIGTNPTWTRLIGGDGGYVAIAPKKNFVYCGFQNGLIYRVSLNSLNDITGFARVDPSNAGGKYLFINPFILDPLNPSKLFTSGGDVIWRNHNLAQIPDGSQKPTSIGWEVLQETRISGYYTAMEKAGDVLYAGALSFSPLLVKVENASEDAQEDVVKQVIGGSLLQGAFMSCIASAPDDPNRLLITFSNYEVPSIFLSVDGGQTFTDVGGNLEENENGSGAGPSVRWAEIAPTESGYKYFVGTSIGLFSTTELSGSETIWTKEGQNIIGQSVITMIDYRGIDGRLVVASHGNGTFSSYLEDPKNTVYETGDNFYIAPGYPNPFDEKTVISFTLPSDGQVKIDIVDSKGALVRNLLFGQQYAGKNAVSWDGKTNKGQQARNGVYYYHLSYNGKTKGGRLILVN